jgi:hypothetical protein
LKFPESQKISHFIWAGLADYLRLFYLVFCVVELFLWGRLVAVSGADGCLKCKKSEITKIKKTNRWMRLG